MIEQLKSTGAQLRTSWDAYYNAFSHLQNHRPARNAPNFLPELSRQLDSELAFISSYETKIQQIKLAISRTRNYLLGQVAINHLPPEILSRIFNLVQGRYCCLGELSSKKDYHPRYPDYLAQVCALWRKTAILTRSLWCHIDLSPYCVGLVARAEIHIARAGELPLELHIAESDYEELTKPYQDYDILYSLISRISNRVETLEFFVTDGFRGFHRSIFKELLLNQHSSFTRLIIRSEHYNDAFITGSNFSPESDEQTTNFELSLTQGEIENSFAALTSLSLDGVFPLWSSTAYHGLVDLRLTSLCLNQRIKEVEFINILSSSPGLRILHFGLKISDLTPNSDKVPPVRLEDLQVVKIVLGTIRAGDVLRFLAPGSRSLWLSIVSYDPETSAVTKEFESFFARSRVTRLHVCGAFPLVATALHRAPHLEWIALADCEHEGDSLSHLPTLPSGVAETAKLPHLKSFHITGSTLFEDQLYLLLDCCPIDIVLYHCKITRTSGPGYTTLSGREIPDTFPSVRITENSHWDPTFDWDFVN